MLLVGSGDENSHSLHLGQAIELSLKAKSTETTLINLAELGLPVYDRAVERTNSYDQKTSDFLKVSREADAYVWVTPVYHNSYSAVLKNALDWQHFFMDDKVVGMASNGGNRAPVAIDHLMVIARSQHLIISPVRVCTDEGEDYDEELNITSETINKRIEDFSNELVKLTKKIRPTT